MKSNKRKIDTCERGLKEGLGEKVGKILRSAIGSLLLATHRQCGKFVPAAPLAAYGKIRQKPSEYMWAAGQLSWCTRSAQGPNTWSFSTFTWNMNPISTSNIFYTNNLQIIHKVRVATRCYETAREIWKKTFDLPLAHHESSKRSPCFQLRSYGYKSRTGTENDKCSCFLSYLEFCQTSTSGYHNFTETRSPMAL